MESSAQGGNRAAEQTATGSPGTNGQVFADDLSDLPADFGRAKTKAAARAADEQTVTGSPNTNGQAGNRRSRWSRAEPSPYDKSSPSVSAKLAAETATEKRRMQWKYHRYALGVLDGREEHWARLVASDIARKDADRDPTRDMPAAMFTGERAVNAGATDEQLAALPKMTPDEIATARAKAAAIREHCRAQIRRKAAAMATPRRPLAEVIRHVADMANDEPTGTIIDGLIYEQTVTHWVGDGGTYKTFTVLALACSVAAGRDFTHQLKVPQRQPVLYFCAERRHYGMGADVAAWCQRSQLDIASLELMGWDDVVQLADDEWMAELTEFVKARGIKLIVFDTQRKATKGIEENSSTDIGAALANAQRLAMQANAAVIVIHHTTRGQDHARGSSVGRDDTDATVLQKMTGPNEAEFIIDKHKSEATGTRYPVKVEKVTGTVPPTEHRAGYGYTTMVASARDPLNADETAAKVHAALPPEDKTLLAVVNEIGDGKPLNPTRLLALAQARGYEKSKDTAARHLRSLAGYGLIREYVAPRTDRKTYGPLAAAQQDDPVEGATDDQQPNQ